MTPYGQRTIFTNTNSEGIAQAVSTEQYYAGNGFDVYSFTPGKQKALTVTATIEGADPVPFSVIVSTRPAIALPLTITVTLGTELEPQLVESVRRRVGLLKVGMSIRQCYCRGTLW